MAIPQTPSPLANVVAAKTYNAQWFSGATKEAQIQNAINSAVADGALAVYIPANMLPYNPSLVTFNSAVQMIREGGNPTTWDVHAYGAVGDGVTDDRVAINAADANAPARATVMFGAGKTYAITTLAGGNCLKGGSAQVWDLNGSSIKYTSTTNVTTGSDGAAIPVVAVLGSPFTIKNGTIDGNSHVAFPVALLGTLTGPFQLEFLTVQNTLEANSTWLGIAYAVSVDVSGVAVTGARAQNVSGFVTRPNCPVVDNTNTIVAHQQVGATLIGGSSIFGNATGSALVNAGGTESTTFLMTCATSKGVPQFFTNSGTLIQNLSFLDFVCYDLGTRHQERYGAVLDVPQRQSFGVGGAYTPGWLDNTGGVDCIDHVITVTANVAVTISNPTNSAGITVDRVGRLRFVIRNTSGGALATAVTFNGTKYRVSGTVSPGNNQQIVVEVLWDQTNDTYIECFRSAAVAI